MNIFGELSTFAYTRRVRAELKPRSAGRHVTECQMQGAGLADSATFHTIIGAQLFEALRDKSSRVAQISSGGHAVPKTQHHQVLSSLENRNVQHDLLMTRDPFHCPFWASEYDARLECHHPNRCR